MRSLLLGLFITAAACSSQADTSYRGEPLATIHGTIQTGNASPPTDVRAVLLWHRVSFDESQQAAPKISFAGEFVPVQGHFPAQFELSLYQPPSDDVLVRCGNPAAVGSAEPTGRAAVALIAAMRPDAPATIEDPMTSPYVLGGVKMTYVVYFDTDTSARQCANLLGESASATRGYHLAQIDDAVIEQYNQVSECRARATTDQERLQCGVPAVTRDSVRNAADDPLKGRLE